GIYRDLEWLGVEWEPPARRQSDHFHIYAEALERLRKLGIIYPAFMSRGEIRAYTAEQDSWPRDPDGAPLYPPLDKQVSSGTQRRRIASGAPFSWRLDMEKAMTVLGLLQWKEFTLDGAMEQIDADPLAWGDVIVARSDIPTSY